MLNIKLFLSKLPSPNFYKLIISVFLFSIIIVSCRKDSTQLKKELTEIISRVELKNWITNYEATITNGPKAFLDNAVKTYYKGQMIVKVPLSSGCGDLYFTKSD
jgi:hypothetical protein